MGHPLIVTLLGSPSNLTPGLQFPRTEVLEVIRKLPPTLPVFDVLGRLLRDSTLVASSGNEGNVIQMNGTPKTTVADLIRTEVLGGFMLNAIGWVERTEKNVAEGLISDDRAAKGIQNVCLK